MYSNVSFKFDGKRALVTGGAQGLGEGIATALLAAGADLFVLDVNKEKLDLLTSKHPTIHTVVADLKDWEATKKAVEGMLPLDLVVNNAGIYILEAFVTAQQKVFDDTVAINARAVLNICQVVANDLIARNKPGSIVNISSMASVIPCNYCSVYGASKAALDMITKSMASEIGKHQIRVNSVLPTGIITETAKTTVRGGEELRKGHMLRIPLGKYAEISEIVGPVLFLLSDCASMVHGHQLRVDGGYSVS